MRAFVAWGRASRDLALLTGRVWWATLPRVLTVYMTAFTLSRLLRFGAAWLATHPTTVFSWLALLALSTALVVLLAGIVLSLRLIGGELALWQPGLAAQHPDVADGPASQLGRTLSVTLLAFLTIYSVFDYITDISDNAVVDAMLMLGGMAVVEDPDATFGYETVMPLVTPLQPDTWGETLLAVAVVAAVWLVGELLDVVAERTKRPFWGLLAAWAEALFLLATLFVVFNVTRRVVNWLTARRVAEWVEDLGDRLPIDIPTALADAWHWFWDTVWAAVGQAVVEPLLWLALAALVLGTKLLDFEALLEEGRLARLLRRLRPTLGDAAAAATQTTFRRWAAVRVQGRLASGLGKYIPTFQVVGIILRSGVGLLGAFVVLYAVLAWAEAWLVRGFDLLWGVHDAATDMWMVIIQEAVDNAVVEPLRFCLLVAAYALAFIRGADRAATPAAVAP
jgi:hypothetical protein